MNLNANNIRTLDSIERAAARINSAATKNALVRCDRCQDVIGPIDTLPTARPILCAGCECEDRRLAIKPDHVVTAEEEKLHTVCGEILERCGYTGEVRELARRGLLDFTYCDLLIMKGFISAAHHAGYMAALNDRR